MWLRSWLLVGLLVIPAAPLEAPAQAASLASPVETVRGYFAALGHHDFQAALGLTIGRAEQSTFKMVSTLEKEASKNDARLEVRVRSLALTEQPRLGDQAMIPVEANFRIELIGHKWFFHRLARTISGSALFFVSRDVPRIVAIEGNLD